MELAQLSLENIDVKDLLPLLLSIDKDGESIQIAPSSFMAEMKLSTEERLEKSRKFQQKLRNVSQLNLNTFDVTPDIIIFQNFKPGTIYTTPISLRNTHTVSRPLRGIFPPSPYFSVSYASETVCTHIAPGMALVFNVKFCAEDVRDYKYNMVFSTEGETFLVPVIAIGLRPLLDLPDQIKLPRAPVKLESQQTILVRNLGQVRAVFTISTKAPFSVNPSKGILLPEQDMQLTIYFKPQKLGAANDYLMINYESGEKLSIKLSGRTEQLKIELEKGALQFHKTFVGLTRQRQIKLYNHSQHVAKFQWKLYSSELQDREHGRHLKNSLRFMQAHEIIKYNKLETFEIIDEEGHAKIYDRIYDDEVEEFDFSNQFLYQNPNFEIIPLTGDVWPGTTFTFTLVFSPTAVHRYNSNAFLEITGREERLKLILNAESIGPRVELNLELLNANKIYMCAVHQYEVVAVNKGDIPAEITYKPCEPEFGGVILCWPQMLHLEPNNCGAFVLQFSSRRQGKFLEEIKYEISGSEEIIRFILIGEIVCPLLNFEVPEIDFGMVPIGYPTRQPVVLRNPSMVPIEFELYIHNDGEIPAITCEEFASLLIKCGPYDNAREFEFFPRNGIVAANSSLCVELRLTPNLIRNCTTTLTANLWGTDQYTVSLPIKYKSCVPHVICVPTEINIRFCFVTYPYKRTIVLYNDSHIPGFFQVLPQGQSKEGGITCTSAITEGFLKPYEEIEIEVTITTMFLGEDKLPFYIQLFGDQPMQCCAITCIGQGPVVTVQPDKMDFGKVTLLEVTSREVTLTNDSPITAFVATSISPKTHFIIEPRALELQPEESAILIISIYLCNPIKVHDKLQIVVENGTNTVCLLKAKGVGTSILCQPKLYPELNIGTVLTYQKFVLNVKLTNKGFRSHKMLWSRNENLKQLKENPENVIPSFFTITPNAMELAFEESIEIKIEGYTRKPGYIEEDFYCHAMLEKVQKQMIIISFVIVAQFVEPVVSMSKQELHFRQDVGPDNTVEFLIDEVTITNKSKLAIDMDVYLKQPFYMLLGTKLERERLLYLQLNNEQSKKIIVEFDPYTDDKRCFVVEEQLKLDYRNHPKTDNINLIGEVNYPNVEIIPNSIQFYCIPTNTVDYREMLLRNISPLPVTYTFEWQEETFIIEKIEPTEVGLPVRAVDSSFSRKSSDSGTYLKELEMRKARQIEEEASDMDSKKVISSKETLLNVEDLELDVPGEKESANLLPTEYIYHRSHIEKDPSYHYIEIQEIVEPALYMKDVLSFPQRNKEYLTEMRNILYGTLAHFDDQENDTEVIKTLPKMFISRASIDTLLDVAPFRGFLKPYECQLVSIGFHPSSNLSILAQAQCHVVGGATELLNVTGMSSDLSYSIEDVFVDFGRQVFCELCKKPLTLSNTGHIEFEFLTSAKQFPNPVPPAFLLEAGCLTVTPKKGLLQAGSAIELQVQYFPGIAGEFNETFTIEIGYLPAITVTVHGYGVFPQAYLYLPRPTFNTLDPWLTYLAVASLTPDYLRSLENVKNIEHYSDTNMYDEDIPKVAREKLKKDGWVIISYNDLYPSTMDIELAIERIILYQHIFDNPTVLLQHTKTHRAAVVPYFTTPSYLVDFGYVILDTVVHYTVLIFNYGPINANVRLVPVGGKKSAFVLAGLAIQFSRCVIRIGETKELFVIFSPSAQVYTDLDSEICFPFYLDVGHGPRIPVNIKAVVTVPNVTPELACLSFGEVRCGDCLKESLMLHNKGHIISEWYAVIEKRDKKGRQRRHSIDKIRKMPVFFLRSSSGILEPESGCSLDVYFEPQFDGNVEWYVVININQNPNEVVVTLKGVGLKPTLKITERKVEFEPVLPYVHRCEKFFTVENVSSFPIEFYFADFDSEIDEEERTVNLLTQFYNLNDLYIPPRAAGQKLPQPLIDFYQNLLESLRTKLIRIEKERLEEEQRAIWLSSVDDENLSRRSSSRRKSLSLGSKSPQSSIQIPSIEIIDPLMTRTPEEIEILLREHLEEYIVESNLEESGSINEKPADPVNAAILEAKGPPVEKDLTDLKEGVYIIFHGAPTTNIAPAANKAGLEVGLPVYSIDRLYFESLAVNSSLATVKVNELIDNAFKEVASEIDLIVEEGTDAYDEVQKKVDLLLSGKEKKPKPKKDSKKGDSSKSSSKKGSKKDSKKSSEKESKKGKKGSSKGSKKEKKKKKDTRPTFMGIPEELLFEILKQRLVLFDTGIVIESLTSTFLRQPVLALNNLLKAIGNENLRQLEEKRMLEEREALILNILEMDAEQFDKLSPEEFTVFKEFVLKYRKANTIIKREALKLRLLELRFGKKAIVGKKDEKKKKKEGGKAAVEKKSVTTKASSVKTKKSKSGKDASTKSVKTKSSKTSKKSKKDSKKGKVKLSPEELEKKQEFNTFESDVQLMLHLLEYWDRKTCVPLKPLPITKGGKGKGSAGKKPSKSKSSKPSSGKKMKTSSKTSVLRLSIEVIPLTPEQESKLKQTGVPCWLLLNAHKDRPVETIVAHYLHHTPELQKATETLEESLKEKIEEIIELYSVLHRTKETRVKNVSDIFILKDAEIVRAPSFEFVEEGSHISPPDDMSRKSQDSKASLGSKAKKLRRSSERRRSSKQSITSLHSSRRSTISTDKVSEKSSIVEREEIFTPRSVLNPGENLRYKVTFKPEACGYYEHIFTIEMTGWPTKFRLTCRGNCDIPRLDMRPESIFAKTVKKRTTKNLYDNSLFLKTLNVFDFGPALVQDKEEIKLLSVETEFNFANDSLLPCETIFTLRDDTEVYEHDPEILKVQPNTTKALTMFAVPTIYENTDNQLIISIKNNPKIETIDLTSEGCTFAFNITPKLIHFDRILINRTETKSVYLENESLVPVNWEFLEPEDVMQHFKISQLTGYVAAKDTQEVFFEYLSEIPEDVAKQTLQVEVYDKDFKCISSLYRDVIEVSAEAIEVTIDCVKEIRLGEVKGRFQHLILYTMLSKGKYSVEFAFTEIIKEQDPLYAEHESIRNYLKITPPTGILQPNKLYTAKLVFFAKKVVDFKNVPILNCTFTDPLYKTVIETFPLMAFAKTFVASFELCPPEQINFGHQLVGTEKIQEMTLTNNGRFDFSYSVLSLRKLLDMKAKKDKKGKKGSKSKTSKSSKSKSKTSKMSKKESKKSEKTKKSKSSKSSKQSSKSSAKKKLKPTKLDAGMFSVISSTGIVEPNETCKIQVFSRPKQVGMFEETVVFFISECTAAEKKGSYISLSVTGCAPSINFDDFEGIFREQYVVNRMAEFECPKEVGAHCVFIKEEARLHFSRTMINKEATARIRLQNNGPIPADVIAKVSSVPENIFSVEPTIFNVDTYSTNYTTISFIPNGINIFEGTLEISYMCPADVKPNKLEIKLSGEGLVPEVVLRQPEFDDSLSCYAINFNPTFTGSGSSSNRLISFENVGILACQVIIEVCEGILDAFTLIPKTETIPILKIWEEVIQATAHTNIIYLHPGQKGEFELNFKPAKAGQFNCLVKLHIVNNPFETFMIFVTAEAYTEDITIEGLPTVTMKRNDSISDLYFTNPGYELDFGYSYINTLQKKCFKITNHSTTATYKFEITVCEKLVFIPAVGHLKPNAAKEIIATFLSKESFNIFKEPLECTIYKIEYLNPDLEPLSWDERQNFVIWEPIANVLSKSPRPSVISNISRASVHSKRSAASTPHPSELEMPTPSNEAAIKTVKEKCEPAIEIVPRTSRCLPLLLSVVCDYTSYQCNEQEIEITDTLAFEKQSYNFEVTNISNMLLELSWKISMDESYPRRINSATCNSNLSFAKRESYNSTRVIQSASQLTVPCNSPSKKIQRPMHLIGLEKFVPDESTPRSTMTKSSLFSSEANFSNRSNDSWQEGDFFPFNITPRSVSIQPKESQTFKVTFTPRDVFNYLVHLQSEISNLHPLLRSLNISVKARSLLPLYHFDIGPNDYLEVRRKGRKFCRDVADENTRVIEFEAIGLGITNTRTFNILNPTGESFSYKWIPADINSKYMSVFHCHKFDGFVEKGKMAEAVFSFFPQSVGVFEAFYIFHIEKYDLSRTFLLAGTAREADVYFLHPHLQIRPTVIGIDITESVILKNNENFEVDFKFRKESVYSEARLQALTVEPLKGILQPRSEHQIKITFHPVKKGEINFNLKCVAEKIKKPLLLSVTASCFEVQPVVFYESDDGSKVILDSDKINVLDLKSMVPHLTQEINFNITNMGVTGFYYSWSMKEDMICNRIKIAFNDTEGFLKSNTEATSVMTVTPLTKVVVKKLKLKLEIRYGPTYVIHLMGSTALALFTFSFDEYDFGPCLIQREATSYYKKIVEFTNNDEIPVVLECKMPNQDHLSINFKSKQIEPKKSEQLVITFNPHEIKQYYTEIQFYINSKAHQLKVQGEGVLHSIDLFDPYDKFIDLGCIPIGKTSTKLVKVVNSSSTPVDIIFDLCDRLPFYSRPRKILQPEFEIEEPPTPKKAKTDKGKKDKKGKKDSKKGSKKSKSSKTSKSTSAKSKSSKASEKGSKKSSKKSKSSKSSKDSKKGKKGKKEKSAPKEEIPPETPEQRERRLIREFVTFSPKRFTRVSPQQSTELLIKFSPTERMKQFTEKVSYQIQDNIETLCLFKGCCLGPDYVLEKNLVACGSVIQGCFNKQKVVLHNKGDIGGSFKWTFEKPQINFMITPKEGYISPGTSVTFLIKFKPSRLSCLIQAKAKCTIEGFKKPLDLTFTGSCFTMPPPKELLKFVCPVRMSDKKSITIQNPTGQTWRITPTVNGQYFVAPEVLIVEPRSSCNCEVTYKPLTMSKEIPHTASIFFNLPEGKGLLYNLTGTAQNPPPVETITREITCKTYHSEVLTVKNWLKTPQKFTVVTEDTKPSTPANKTLYKLTGNDAIDVLAQSERDYTWTIYVLNEGVLNFKVIFKNVTTNEYLFYEVSLTVTKCPPLEVIKLTTCIRIPVTHTVKLQNPIKTAVVFALQCTSPELTFEKTITVPPYSEYPLEVKYNPLLLGETEAHLEITAKELGTYPYDFILIAHPPIPEPYVCFTGSLGQIVSQKTILVNTANANADFICQIEHPDIFYLDKPVSIAPQQKGEFDIYFEPSCLGNIQSTLSLSSSVTGTYIYPLVGTCNLPKPQGPFFIRPGGSTTILFKNPFNEPKSFTFAVEPAIFSLKSTFEDVKARKEVRIIASLLPLRNLEILIDQKYPITGKLVAYCTESHLSYIKWIYYLQGDLLN